MSESSNEYARRSYHKHKEERQKGQTEWRQSEEGRKIKNAHLAKSFAKARGAEGLMDLIALDDLYTRDKGICGICKEPCDRSAATMDHIKPIKLKGTHTWDNVQLAHRACNRRKGNN